jgi:hypothetical protein
LTVVLSVTSPAGVAPTTESLTLTRTPKSSNFEWILGASGIMAISVLVIAGALRKWPKKQDKNADHIIYTDATFSFAQSWVTAISAILTAVGAIFTTTGVLTDLVPGIDTGFFLAITVVYGIVLFLAPLVYSIFQKTDADNNDVYGRRSGFVIASAIVATAVGGQLATVGAIVWLSDLDKDIRQLFLCFLGVVAVLIILYIESTRRQLWMLKKPSTDSATKTKPSIAPLV